MVRNTEDTPPGPNSAPPAAGRTTGRPAGGIASSGLLVAVGMGIGNVLAYGFNVVLAKGLGQTRFAELGTLLSVFLVGSVPGLAVQAVNARRVALAVDGPPEAMTDLCRRLRRLGLVVGAGVAVTFVALAPVISALLPALSTAGIAWTGVSLAGNTVFAAYLGLAQGTSRFITMTALYLAANAARLLIGIAAAYAAASPAAVMALQSLAWVLAAAAGQFLLRDLTDRPAAPKPFSAANAGIPAPRLEVTGLGRKPSHGYVPEVLRAGVGLGGILLLTVLDALFAGRYLTGASLGRYNAGALIARAAFFGPQFITVLAYPRLARPDERRRALSVALSLTIAIGAFCVGAAALIGNTLVKAAFGRDYATASGTVTGTGIDLGTHAWLFASVGALLAVVQLALLDGVARRSHLVSGVVLTGIAAESVTIGWFAHSSPAAIVTAAASCAAGMALVSVTLCLTARVVPAGAGDSVLAGHGGPGGRSVGALPRTSS